ncbi:DUF2971 domain-containing protein [Pseudoduganella sp. FT25W]|uniref:DUF2971 domain-containing protein n=1 Tax=Duganella alba TaxID=2666081 RepID=A0A6L5QC37_9BURK|nr:DUF2971 domain-containing protein [Duganella alba]MRX07307.1 DUF2971 domain-containing protein [Duganella alba]MRX14998.1 DUF2971 domain-containing protein [Duganella alba]
MDSKLNEHFSVSAEKPLYHYTSLSSLVGIATRRELWASHVYYLNDSKEIIHACELLDRTLDDQSILDPDLRRSNFFEHLRRWVGELKGRRFHLFVFSLSEERSLLSQWRSYTTHGKGVSIEFSTGLVKQLAQDNKLRLGRCLYHESEHHELLANVVQYLLDRFENCPNIGDDYLEYAQLFEDYHDTVLSALYLIKHGSFSEEKEWRLIMSSEFAYPQVSYREGATMMIPYVALKIGPGRVFNSILLGPCENIELALYSMTGFLGRHEICKAVAPSYIPYREWKKN